MAEDVYWRLYDEEAARLQQFQSYVAFPLGLLSILGGTIVYLLQRYHEANAFWTWAYVWTIAVALYCFIRACHSLVRSYFGYKYKRLPFPKEVLATQLAIEAYHAKKGTAETVVAQRFAAALRERFVEAAEINARHNVNRGLYLHGANAAIIASFFFTALCILPALRMYASTEEPAQRVRIVGVEGLPNGR